LVFDELPLKVAPLALAVERASVGGVVSLVAVACPDWSVATPVVALVTADVEADAAVPPLFVVFESEPLVPAPLGAVDAAPPMAVECAARARAVALLELASLEMDEEARSWIALQLASIRTPR